MPYDHYEINLQVEERSEVPGYEYLGDQLVITANVGVNGNTLVKVENPTGQMIDQVSWYAFTISREKSWDMKALISPGWRTRAFWSFSCPGTRIIRRFPMMILRLWWCLR